jgi:hypothetical protein
MQLKAVRRMKGSEFGVQSVPGNRLFWASRPSSQCFFFVGFCVSARIESDSLESNETIAIDAMWSLSPSLVALLLFWAALSARPRVGAVVMVIFGAIWLCCNRESDDESDDEMKLKRIGSVS